ncbi:MAG: DNA-3-methyladenine glycosylase [Chlamydiae bacterium]|nr:DNA-3-methyladenine glycosylase [Chlamydiota bacterium]
MVNCSTSPHPSREKKEKLNRLIFENPDVVEAAKNLLGKGLFTKVDGHLTGGIITETEAYLGIEDKASHAFGGRRTKRTEVMYQKGGVAYVYLCYGIHALLNVITGEEGIPKAVLIRAIKPTHGIDIMLTRRKKNHLDRTLTNGPGSLTAALGITLSHNKLSFDSPLLWIEDLELPVPSFESTPRIGVDYADEWAEMPYRFVAK